MKQFGRIALSFCLVAPVFLAGDFCWLSLSNPLLYQPLLAPHLAERYDWLAVAVFYPLYFVGILAFVVRPLEEQRCRTVLLRGVLFGLVAYATYDMTNQATLRGWPWCLSLIDMGWGGFITGFSALVARYALNKALKQKSAI